MNKKRNQISNGEAIAIGIVLLFFGFELSLVVWFLFKVL